MLHRVKLPQIWKIMEAPFQIESLKTQPDLTNLIVAEKVEQVTYNITTLV